ncbi:hypothetical protein [Planctomicrobium sp. SH527]|uniref:hypothetical protein n=1 Tax=Planctomicrobium sp. SH527 TaxID=3448123 RepID=UPI003F5C9779
MISVKQPLFYPGRIVATPAALESLEAAEQAAWEFIAKHISGDWGVVDDEDKESNNQSLKDGSRLLSAYLLKTGEKIWLITEAADDRGNREATTLLLPEEY